MCGVVTNQGEDIKWSDEIRGSCYGSFPSNLSSITLATAGP
jgi:hypothetical protein